LQRILGGFSGGTGGLDLGHLVGPILQQILGGRRAARMALVGQLTGRIFGGLGF
jgi:hypothetical protein